MKRVFITTIPLQGARNLESMEYIPVGFSFHRERRETCFPIIPVIAEQMEQNDEIRILVIQPTNCDTAKNYQLFLSELRGLGLEESCITAIHIPENQNMETEASLLMQLVDAIPNHSIVNACVTFGTKPVSIIVIYALTFLRKLISDVEVEGIYYGEVLRVDGRIAGRKGKIYNLIGMLMIGNIIDQLNLLGIDNPKQSLKRLLDLPEMLSEADRGEE